VVRFDKLVWFCRAAVRFMVCAEAVAAMAARVRALNCIMATRVYKEGIKKIWIDD
jgi:hypothetical protein